jgi:hypothetical protein
MIEFYVFIVESGRAAAKFRSSRVVRREVVSELSELNA